VPIRKATLTSHTHQRVDCSAGPGRKGGECLAVDSTGPTSGDRTESPAPSPRGSWPKSLRREPLDQLWRQAAQGVRGFTFSSCAVHPKRTKRPFLMQTARSVAWPEGMSAGAVLVLAHGLGAVNASKILFSARESGFKAHQTISIQALIA